MTHVRLLITLGLIAASASGTAAEAAPQFAPKPIAYYQAQAGSVMTKVPPNAIQVLPILRSTIDEVWPDLTMRSFMAAQIEQESCIHLTHSKCWNSHSELKTSREYGFGYGQTTVAFRKDGTERFNVWKELSSMDPVLKEKWTWENRYDPAMQMRALLIKNRVNYSSIRFTTANEFEKLAFTAVTYNSGSTLIDRNICVRTRGCNPSVWFGNVELYTKKSMIPHKGYGKSFAEISREYPRNLLYIRRAKYMPLLGS